MSLILVLIVGRALICDLVQSNKSASKDCLGAVEDLGIGCAPLYSYILQVMRMVDVYTGTRGFLPSTYLDYLHPAP